MQFNYEIECGLDVWNNSLRRGFYFSGKPISIVNNSIKGIYETMSSKCQWKCREKHKICSITRKSNRMSPARHGDRKILLSSSKTFFRNLRSTASRKVKILWIKYDFLMFSRRCSGEDSSFSSFENCSYELSARRFCLCNPRGTLFFTHVQSWL